jgi:hypothetical protein
MIQAAANFGHYPFLGQLIFESTVTGRPIDMQTYVKVILAVYIDLQ